MGDEGLELNESHAAKTTLSETGGPGGGPLADDSKAVAQFCGRLRHAGFTSNQLKQINNALRECGLEIVAGESVGG